MKILIGIVILLVLSGILLGVSRRRPEDAMSDAGNVAARIGTGVPVLVELFTSEGCSSCPPADEVLTRLQQQQPVAGAEIITLSEHVDYWNHLGWSDPFSSSQFSARQTAYARLFGGDSIYTPQMVVDGQDEFVGSNVSAAHTAIAKAARGPKATVSIDLPYDNKPTDRNKVELGVQLDNLGGWKGRADVYLAVAESGLASSVQRGENKGRNLTHTSVVRSLEIIGSLDSRTASRLDAHPTLKLAGSWNRSHLRVVAFAQDRTNLHIFGATSVALTERAEVAPSPRASQ
jgi:hypothetical protein